MRIREFNARAVHGFMNFDIRFYDDLTFLTGINGSGKTTVVNAISALLSPSLLPLVNLQFESMQLAIRDDEQTDISIYARKEDGKLILSASVLDDELSVAPLPIDEDEAYLSYRERERIVDYYREFVAENSSHPVMKLYRELPTPMYLGIERRISEFLEPEGRVFRLTRRRRPPRLLSGPLDIGLYEAVDIAEMSYRRIQAKQRELTDELRTKLLLNALKYEEGGKSREYRIPKISDEEIEEKVTLTRQALQRLGVPPEEVGRHLQPFFNKLASLSALLEGVERPEEILQSDDEETRSALAEWFINYPQYVRITTIIEYVEDYINQSHEANSPIDRYLGIVNNFLADSHKKLRFDETGSLTVSFREDKEIPIESLSSGESQVVVIITQLSFNPAAQRANVFIVDEPELSLHVHWQELFVESIREANPDLQLILATHSPSIILDNTENCVDLSEVVL